jgi:hypothetical protein
MSAIALIVLADVDGLDLIWFRNGALPPQPASLVQCWIPLYNLGRASRQYEGGTAMKQVEPFRFTTELHLVELTGLTATNLAQLLDNLRIVPGSSIFYHTHQRFLSHHFETPIVYNDFAVWVGEALREDALSEKLAAIDMLAFTSVRQLREEIVSRVENYLGEIGGRARQSPPGDEFHFCKSKSFALPLGVQADSVADFFCKLEALPISSLYFHFLEAPFRLEQAMNDFSYWLSQCGEEALANEIDALDPYGCSLDELKSEIIELGRKKGAAECP